MLKTNKMKERIENKHYREEKESKGLKKKKWNIANSYSYIKPELPDFSGN